MSLCAAQGTAPNERRGGNPGTLRSALPLYGYAAAERPNKGFAGDALQRPLLTSLPLPGAPETWRWADDNCSQDTYSNSNFGFPVDPRLLREVDLA